MKTFNDVIEYFGSATKTAEALDVTVQAVCFWRDGERKISAEIAARSEKVTNKHVTRKDLFPDNWIEIWPELANEEAA